LIRTSTETAGRARGFRDRVGAGAIIFEVDPNNPVVQLCAQGMELEGKGRLDEASQVFLNAWNQSADDFERCIAALYVARHQKNAVDALLWNQRSLDHADAVVDERPGGFYPSLYLNMGKAHEDLGNHDESKRFYEMAATLVSLPEGRYGEIVREAVGRALRR
jgi:tetratricopeptide (TPR) repeat protein